MTKYTVEHSLHKKNKSVFAVVWHGATALIATKRGRFASGVNMDHWLFCEAGYATMELGVAAEYPIA